MILTNQPLEVIKTTMAANWNDSFITALRRIWSQGGFLGCIFLSPVDASILTQYSLPRLNPLGMDRSIIKRRRATIHRVGINRKPVASLLRLCLSSL